MLKEHGLQVTKLGLADKLKDSASAVFEIDRDIFDDQSRKEVAFKRPIILRENHLQKLEDVYAYLLKEPLELSHNRVGRLLYTPREVLQVVGTDILRKARPDIHLDVAAKFRDLEKISVITDCRFPNEVDWVHRQGGSTIYVFRPEADRVARESKHPSEHGVPDLRFKCNFCLDNTGTIEELSVMVKELLPHLPT
jgi:hypothetical protein